MCGESDQNRASLDALSNDNSICQYRDISLRPLQIRTIAVDWLTDPAVGWQAEQIKVGSMSRSERTAKWNRLVEI